MLPKIVAAAVAALLAIAAVSAATQMRPEAEAVVAAESEVPLALASAGDGADMPSPVVAAHGASGADGNPSGNESEEPACEGVGVGNDGSVACVGSHHDSRRGGTCEGARALGAVCVGRWTPDPRGNETGSGNSTHGNHTDGNHGNHTGGNHTGGNQTSPPQPVCDGVLVAGVCIGEWTQPEDNSTHGNETHRRGNHTHHGNETHGGNQTGNHTHDMSHEGNHTHDAGGNETAPPAEHHNATADGRSDSLVAAPDDEGEVTTVTDAVVRVRL